MNVSDFLTILPLVLLASFGAGFGSNCVYTRKYLSADFYFGLEGPKTYRKMYHGIVAVLVGILMLVCSLFSLVFIYNAFVNTHDIFQNLLYLVTTFIGFVFGIGYYKYIVLRRL